MRKLLLPTLIGLLLSAAVHAQQGIAVNATGNAPDASAMLDIQSTAKGMLVPRMSAAQRTAIATPATGLLVYDTDSNAFFFRSSTAWTKIATGNPSGADNLGNHTATQNVKLGSNWLSNDGDAEGIRVDNAGKVGIGTSSPVSQSAMTVNGSASLTGQDANWFAGGNRGFVDYSGSNLRLGSVPGGGSDVQGIVFVGNGQERWRMTGTRLVPQNSGQSVFIGDSTGANDDLTNNGNTFLGYKAGVKTTTGSYNVAVGLQALYANTSGGNNSALGLQSLQANTTGSNNVAVGNQSMLNHTSGSNNVAIGSGASYTDQSGVYNTVIGNDALFYNVSGQGNTALGRQAGFSATGGGNVFIGNAAGYSETGSNKLYIDNSNTTLPLVYGDFSADSLRVNGKLNVNGYYSLPQSAGTSGYVLTTNGVGQANWTAPATAATTHTLASSGNILTSTVNSVSATASAVNSNALSLSGSTITSTVNGVASTGLNISSAVTAAETDPQVSSTTTGKVPRWDGATLSDGAIYDNSSAVGIGNNAPAEKLDVTGNIRASDTIKTAKLKMTNGATAGYVLTSDASGNATWTSPTATPTSYIQDADADTRIRTEASPDEDKIRFDLAGTERWQMNSTRLVPSNSGGSVFIGSNAGHSDDLTNNSNVFVGENTGANNTTGIHNVALGLNSLGADTNANYNVAIGDGAMLGTKTGDHNISIGRLSMQYQTGGFNNVAVGAFALNQNVIGMDNIALGYNAGHDATGNQNIFIGRGSGYNNLGSGSIFLGYSAGSAETGSNKLYIDNSSTGTPLIYGDFASDSLRVNGKLNVNGYYTLPSSAGTNGYILSTNGAGQASWVNPATIAVTGDNLGNHTATQNLNMSGKIISVDGGSSGLMMGSNGQVVDSGSYGSGTDLAITGAGTRMMWLPKKAAFRAGNVNGTQWNNANIGNYSVAMGQNLTASGDHAMAFGNSNVASGPGSFTAGWLNTASGTLATALGQQSTASGYGSTAMGIGASAGGDAAFAAVRDATASGDRSIAIGQYVAASGSNSVAIGRYATAGLPGSMVLGDSSATLASSDAANQLKGRFKGGYKFYADEAQTNGVQIAATTGVAKYFNNVAASYDARSLTDKNYVDSNVLAAVSAVSITETDPQVSSTTTSRVPRWTGTTLSDGALYDNGTSIGLGNTAPAEKLHVTGNIKASDTIKTAKLQMTNGATNGYVLTSDASGNAAWTAPATAATTNALSLSGTTLTSTVNGVASSQSIVSAVTAAETDPQVSSATTNIIPRWSGTTLTDGVIYDDGTNAAIGATSAPAESKLVLGAINTGNEGGQLQLNGTTTYPTAAFVDNWKGRFRVMSGTNTGSSATRMMVDTSGYVGIGTTLATPTERLEVSGNIKASDTIKTAKFKMTNGATAGYVLTSDASGNATWQSAVSAGETDPQVSSSTTNKIPRWTGTTLSDGLIQDNGSSGIGVNCAPISTAPLSVQTLADAGSFAPLMNLGTSSSPDLIKFYDQTTGLFGPAIEFNSTNPAIFLGDGDISFKNTGQVGINMFNPDANLDVNGTYRLGTNGTILNYLIKSTVSKDVASVAAGSSSTETFSVTGATTGATVHVSPASDLGSLVIASARVSTSGTVTVRFVNPTGAAIDPSSMNFYLTVIN